MPDVPSYINEKTLPFITLIIGGIGGVFVRGLFLTKTDRLKEEQTKYENARLHRERLEQLYSVFTTALVDFKKAKNIDLQLFIKVTTSGEAYFSELKIVADSILSGRIDKNSRDNDITQRIIEALEKNILLYYVELQKIAKKNNWPYEGKFKRRNYQSLIAVVEKYAPKIEIPESQK